MAVISKNTYPRATPLHSPDELAAQAARLKQQQEELTAQARRLAQRDKELADKATRVRRWTVRLAWACAAVLLVAAGATAFNVRQARAPVPGDANTPSPTLEVVTTPESPLVLAPKVAPLALPANAGAKPDSQKADFLEALGGLSATHLYQSHLNIGLLADGVESETYTIEEAEKNLKSVTDLMKLVDGQLAKLSKAGLDVEDQDSLRQIQAVAGLLHLQADALRAYWTTCEMKEANDFQQARAASWQGLVKVMGLDD